ncbi:mitochondrial fission 1 protein MDV2 [Acrasis kona]|uniref:Mitochondrial fission 1 protein MDV2 n=1 Tax=Acrasis kona TaxID=1008807 RepID=A0AAW2Z3B6_9EUKA
MSNTEHSRIEQEARNLEEQFENDTVDPEQIRIQEKVTSIDRSDANLFVLATLYVKSRDQKMTEQGFEMLRILLQQHNSTSFDSYESNSRHYKRDVMYLMAVGHYYLAEYPEARRWLERLLQFDPSNYQAPKFLHLIDRKIADDGKKGLAIAGGAAVIGGIAAVGGIILMGILNSKRK